MADEIDLLEYIKVLFGNWRWIAGLALVAALTALVIGFLLPPTFGVSAVVLVTEPRYQMGFDARFKTEETAPAYKALPALATSDEILQKVVESYDPLPEARIDDWDLGTLSGMVEASSKGDPSLVVLGVTSHSAQDAAAVANRWADVLIRHANEIYGENEGDVVFFEEQMAQAEQAADQAEAALVKFQARNLSTIVQAQLVSFRTTQSDYLTDQRQITYIIQDILGLRDQMARQPEDQPISLADSLTALSLQVMAFNAEASAPIELQVASGQTISDKSPSQQTALLDGLVATLQAKSAVVDERLAQLEPQILASQEQLQRLDTEYDRLTRDRDLSLETYMTLARKLEEVRISAQGDIGALQVGSYATVPRNPVGPRRLLMAAVGGVFGLLVGSLLAVAIGLWHRNPPEDTEFDDPQTQ